MTTCKCARAPYPHPRERLCEITSFNLFLGEVQRRLMEEGYDPPAWPDSKIRDQGDLDDALDVCVQWCKDRLDALRPEAAYPEGWKLVPIKPTEDMMRAAGWAISDIYAKEGGWCGPKAADDQNIAAWNAMLDVSPQPQRDERKE